MRWSTGAPGGGTPRERPFFLGRDGTPRADWAHGVRFLFTGREYLAPLGLYDYRHRAYSPTLGRFLQVDPMGLQGEISLYRSVGNEPHRFADPLGLVEADLSYEPSGGRAETILKEMPDPPGRERMFIILGHPLDRSISDQRTRGGRPVPLDLLVEEIAARIRREQCVVVLYVCGAGDRAPDGSPSLVERLQFMLGRRLNRSIKVWGPKGRLTLWRGQTTPDVPGGWAVAPTNAVPSRGALSPVRRLP